MPKTREFESNSNFKNKNRICTKVFNFACTINNEQETCLYFFSKILVLLHCSPTVDSECLRPLSIVDPTEFVLSDEQLVA